MRNMKQGGVGVGTMSHKCEKYESGWGRCEKKRRRVRVKSVRVVTASRGQMMLTMITNRVAISRCPNWVGNQRCIMIK